jgi:hypothetical protein
MPINPAQPTPQYPEERKADQLAALEKRVRELELQVTALRRLINP